MDIFWLFFVLTLPSFRKDICENEELSQCKLYLSIIDQIFEWGYILCFKVLHAENSYLFANDTFLIFYRKNSQSEMTRLFDTRERKSILYTSKQERNRVHHA